MLTALGSHRCAGCLAKQRRIDDLEVEVARLRKENARQAEALGRQERGPTERPFGEATRPSQEPFKGNATEADRQRRGGAPPGHRGHGRKTPPTTLPPEPVAAPPCCPACGGTTTRKKVDDRYVTDVIPERTVTRHFRVETRRCAACGQLTEATVPGVGPQAKYSDLLLVTVLHQHYVQGRTQGDIQARLGLGRGAFNQAAQRVATLLQPCLDRLVQEFLASPVRFADESGQREDGVNRYLWLLSTASCCLFLAGQTRAADVVWDRVAPFLVPGQMVAGVLVVDRYVAYGCLPFVLQYCYAHLKRDAETLEKKYPEEPEVQAFCQALIHELAAAMKLRRQPLDDPTYYAAAAALKARLIALTSAPARHPAVQDLQNVFRQNPHRLYHWARDRRVPADNNFSERGLRPWVIARHLSYGTQSKQGSWRRTILMSVLHSLVKRGADPVAQLCAALARQRADPQFDVVSFLFPPRAAEPPLRAAPDPPPPTPARAPTGGRRRTRTAARDAPRARAS